MVAVAAAARGGSAPPRAAAQEEAGGSPAAGSVPGDRALAGDVGTGALVPGGAIMFPMTSTETSADFSDAASPEAVPTPPRRRGPGRPRAGSEDKRERILNEAVTLFGARGYAGTSLADVAAAADISKAGLLHHFSSKEQLFAKVLERRDRQDVADFLGQEDGQEPLDPWEHLERYIDLLRENAQKRALVAIYAATSVSVLDAEHPAHDWMAEHLAQAVRGFEASFEQGKQTGVVDPQMPSRVVARTLVALSDGLQLQWLCSTTPGGAASPVLATGLVEEIRLYVDSLRAQWGRGEAVAERSRPGQG